MPNQLYQGFLYDDAGVAINGATVNLYDVDTTTPVRATTTTSATGLWTISHATEGRFDVEIVNGSSKRRHKYNAQIQISAIEVATLRVRNPAFTFDYDIVPAAITADRQLNLPLITATDTVAVLALAQTFLTGVKTFNSSILAVRNPADTFSYTLVASAITAARNLTIPLITADDTVAVLGLAQTFSAAQTLSAAGAAITLSSATGAIVIGTNPSSAGAIRLANNLSMNARNTDNTGDIQIFGVSNDTVSVLEIGASPTTNRVRLGATSGRLSFLSVAVPVAQQTVTGARAGNAGLASLLTGLAAYGLVVDSTTAGSSSAVIRAGGNTTEATTTSTTAVSLLATGTLSLTALAPQLIVAAIRKTTGAVASVSTGVTVNATEVQAPLASSSTANEAQSGIWEAFLYNNVSLYVRGRFTVYMFGTGGGNSAAAFQTADMPAAAITSVTLRGLVGDALVTLGADELNAYEYARA